MVFGKKNKSSQSPEAAGGQQTAAGYRQSLFAKEINPLVGHIDFGFGQAGQAVYQAPQPTYQPPTFPQEEAVPEYIPPSEHSAQVWESVANSPVFESEIPDWQASSVPVHEPPAYEPAAQGWQAPSDSELPIWGTPGEIPVSGPLIDEPMVPGFEEPALPTAPAYSDLDSFATPAPGIEPFQQPLPQEPVAQAPYTPAPEVITPPPPSSGPSNGLSAFDSFGVVPDTNLHLDAPVDDSFTTLSFDAPSPADPWGTSALAEPSTGFAMGAEPAASPVMPGDVSMQMPVGTEQSGQFLDSVHRDLYPEQSVFFDQTSLTASEEAFDEAAQFLFPETMHAIPALGDPAAPAAAFDDFVSAPATLGPSYADTASPLYEISEQAPPPPVNASFVSPEPVAPPKAAEPETFSPEAYLMPPVTFDPTSLEEELRQDWAAIAQYEAEWQPAANIDEGAYLSPSDVAQPSPLTEDYGAFASFDDVAPTFSFDDAPVYDMNESPNYPVPELAVIPEVEASPSVETPVVYEIEPPAATPHPYAEPAAFEQPAEPETAPPAEEDDGFGGYTYSLDDEEPVYSLEPPSHPATYPETPVIAQAVEPNSTFTMADLFEEEEASAPPPPASQPAVDPNSLDLETFEVLGQKVLAEGKRIIVAQCGSSFAIFGEVGLPHQNPQPALLKLLAGNPLAGDPEVLSSLEAKLGSREMYRVKMGAWNAIISVDNGQIAVHTELTPV